VSFFLLIYRAVGALSSDPKHEPELRHQIDHIIAGAVEFGIFFRSTGTTNLGRETSPTKDRNSIGRNNPDNVYDLSCLSFPVARATCRYVLMNQILPLHSQIESINATEKSNPTTSKTVIPNVMFITGSGLQHRLTRGNRSDHLNTSCNNNNNSVVIGIHPSRSMFMREYIQCILWNDFGLHSLVVDQTVTSTANTMAINNISDNNYGSTGSAGSNVVTVKAEILKEWLAPKIFDKGCERKYKDIIF
jgi:hypothetical protein